jgi:hypothetical protein
MRLPAMIAAACTVLVAACDSPTPVDELGRLTGRLDEAAWVGTATMGIGPVDQGVIVSRDGNLSGERMITVELPMGVAPGTFAIPAGGAWYSATPRNGDAYYAIAQSGTLLITSVGDTFLRGSLELTLEGPGGHILHFTDGEFEVPIGRRLF